MKKKTVNNTILNTTKQKQQTFFAIKKYLTMQSLWLAFPATLLQWPTRQRTTTIAVAATASS